MTDHSEHLLKVSALELRRKHPRRKTLVKFKSQLQSRLTWVLEQIKKDEREWRGFDLED